MVREIAPTKADRDLLVVFIRQGVSIRNITGMYCCTANELNAYVSERMPNLSNLLGACPDLPTGQKIAADDYPPMRTDW